MFQHRLTVILDFVRKFFDGRGTASECLAEKACVRGFSRLASRLSRSWVTRTGPLHYMLQAIQGLQDDSSICQKCRTSFEHDVWKLRAAIWEELPSVIGLPGWKELEAVDLPP